MAGNYDVVIASYQLVSAQYSKRISMDKKIRKFLRARADGSAGPVPARPITALFSDVWTQRNQPWKRLVVDEAHFLSKREQNWNKAIRALPYKRAVLLTGTPSKNTWTDFSGLIALLRGHPFANDALFLHTFSDYRSSGRLGTLGIERERLLQRFLQAIMIARHEDVVEESRPKLKCFEVLFKMDPADEGVVDALTSQFVEVSQRNSPTGLSDSKGNKSGIAAATRALRAACHPLLLIKSSSGSSATKEDYDYVDG